MEEKLRVIIENRIEKLVLPSGIPPTVKELQTTVKENFEISEEFSLQYLKITSLCIKLTTIKDTIKVVYATPVILNSQPVDENFDSA